MNAHGLFNGRDSFALNVLNELVLQPLIFVVAVWPDDGRYRSEACDAGRFDTAVARDDAVRVVALGPGHRDWLDDAVFFDRSGQVLESLGVGLNVVEVDFASKPRDGLGDVEGCVGRTVNHLRQKPRAIGRALRIPGKVFLHESFEVLLAHRCIS